MFQQTCLIALLVGIMASAQEKHQDFGSDSNEHNQEGIVFHNEYLPFDEMMDGAAGDDRTFRLRGRELQTLTTQPVCSATYPHFTFVCGQPDSGVTNPCIDSTATCSSLPDYKCSCTGSLEGTTSCSYCQVVTFNGIMCQVSNSRTTYSDVNLKQQTCECMYIGSGQVKQTCYTPTLAPASGPVPLSPTGVRSLTALPPASSPIALPAIPAVRSTPVPTPSGSSLTPNESRWEPQLE
jgi:hypothetical protein